MRFGLLTLAVLCAMTTIAGAEPATYPAARILRPLTLPGGGWAGSTTFRFDDGLAHDDTAAQIAYGVLDRFELRGALTSGGGELGFAVALDDGRGAANLAVEAVTSFRDIPAVAGLHARVRLRDVWMRTPPSQLIVLHGDGETEVVGRLPVAFGFQAAPRLALECQVSVVEYARNLGTRILISDQLELRAAAWLTLTPGRGLIDVGAVVDVDPLHGSTSEMRYWVVGRWLARLEGR